MHSEGLTDDSQQRFHQQKPRQGSVKASDDLPSHVSCLILQLSDRVSRLDFSYGSLAHVPLKDAKKESKDREPVTALT